MGDDDQPKIIVDSDWKAQAQAEKQKIAEKADQDEKKPAQGDPGELPPADFNELLRLLIGPALMYMGGVPDPQTGKAIVALDIAKYHIDLLGVLEDKTKNNLSEEESEGVRQVLHELRLRYVEVEKLVAEAAAKGVQTIDPAAPGSPL